MRLSQLLAVPLWRVILHPLLVSPYYPTRNPMSHIVIFDLDGTLCNTIADLGNACNYALSACQMPTHKEREYPRLVGNGINKLIERALPDDIRSYSEQSASTHSYITDDALRQQLILKVRQHFIPYYNQHLCDKTTPYEGITTLLRYLKNEGWLLAVASNKYQEATEHIVRHFFPDVFDVILGEREGIERKPNPQIVYDILSSLDARNSSQVFYIGDSLVDMQTARNAGLPFIACSWGFVKKEVLEASHPDYLVTTPAEIIPILQKSKFSCNSRRC